MNYDIATHHLELLERGYALVAVVPAYWEERGDAESGPLGLIGYPAYREYCDADSRVIIECETGRAWFEWRDLDMEQYFVESLGR